MLQPWTGRGWRKSGLRVLSARSPWDDGLWRRV
uniref:Uncharacterized protein n=1 Tax=Arundo donax TaxID=35708 RepID=A0A0A9A7L8_ARUDO